MPLIPVQKAATNTQFKTTKLFTVILVADNIWSQLHLWTDGYGWWQGL